MSTPLSTEFKQRLDFLATDPLDIYARSRNRIREDVGTEEVALAGGYFCRQITELIQNGADAIAELESNGEDARIEVILTDRFLYVANTGAPLSGEGLNALLTANSSPKRGCEIGRFGLGFKSLLRLGGTIEVFSKTNGNIFFDPERCKQEILQRFSVKDAPGLRLAWPLESSDADSDMQFAGLCAWAETIIRAELKTEGCLDALKKEMREFKAEFLLFLPVSVRMAFSDFSEAGQPSCREVSVESGSENQKRLLDGKTESLWYVFKKDVSVTNQRAKDDATHVHQRDSIPLVWAYPAAGQFQQVSGKFWAFFPTQSESRIAGILNAPWKLNSDRTALVAGPWNEALFREIVGLVAESLPSLVSSDDAGGVLEAFPRQVERKDELAAPLVEEVWNHILSTKSIPDGNGVLRQPQELLLHPFAEAKILAAWDTLADADTKKLYPHPSCFTKRDRLSRLQECATRLEKSTTGNALKTTQFTDWMASVAKQDADGAKQVLLLAEECRKQLKGDDWEKTKSSLTIIPTTDGSLQLALNTILATGDIPTDRVPVLPELAQDAECRKILVSLGVKEPDDNLWKETLTRLLPSDATGGWEHFWKNLRTAPQQVVESFISKHPIRVKRADGQWVLPTDTLLPGGWVKADDEQNATWLVDGMLHQSDSTVLKMLGSSATYSGTSKVDMNETLLADWKDEVGIWGKRNYQIPVPLQWAVCLCGTSRSQATMDAIRQIVEDIKNDPTYNYEPQQYVSLNRFNEVDCYGRSGRKVKNPILWLLRKYGTITIEDTLIDVRVIACRKDKASVWLHHELKDWKVVFERITDLECEQEDLPSIQAFWRAVMHGAVTPKTVCDVETSELYRDAAEDDVVPETLPIGKDDSPVPLAQVTVTSSSKLADVARRNNLHVILLDEKTFEVWRNAGANDLANEIHVETQGLGEQLDVRTVIPELGQILSSAREKTYPCRLADSITQTLFGQSETLLCLAEEGELLLLKSLGDATLRQRLKSIVPEIIGLGWCDGTMDEVLGRILDSTVASARSKVRGKKRDSLAERLLRAVGVDPLRNALNEHIGGEGLSLFNGLDGMKLAEIALSQFGVSVLTNFVEAMKGADLKPPKRWGTDAARQFVVELGFPVEYAAASGRKREAEEIINGPLYLPPLHDFQEEVMEGISALIPRDNFRRRAVVSLPTGGGKTRVTVQAAVELVLKPEGERRSVVWIAQTDELCEQAVQAVRQVWVNLGAQGTDLRIIRLWGGQATPDEQPMDKPIVVVASVQTLNNRFGGLDWLSSPGLVVMDECHHAIAPSYTSVLRWLDAEAPRLNQKEKPKEEPPIIGLSATPFRTDEDESARLAKRFDNIWFPPKQDTLYAQLLATNVLSRIKTDALASNVALIASEMELLERLEREEVLNKPEGIKALEEIDNRLADIVERNALIAERITQALAEGEAKSILFFANSVKHARKMSVLLNKAGVSAAPIDGETPRSARRDFLAKFQRGEIKVLCNHSVLTTGFDSPKTDMILISRTIFSPVAYMQIVGRGLRGPKNGGTLECLLITVKDNIGRFIDRYAYHYCQRYFNQITEGSAHAANVLK